MNTTTASIGPGLRGWPRLGLPVGARDLRLPAKPTRAPASPALLWTALLRGTWWRLQRAARPRPAQPVLWC